MLQSQFYGDCALRHDPGNEERECDIGPLALAYDPFWVWHDDVIKRLIVKGVLLVPVGPVDKRFILGVIESKEGLDQRNRHSAC